MFESKTALVIGLGGLGCPAALALVAAGVGHILLADDDVVDVTNLHRQILYADADVGTEKLVAAERALYRAGAAPGSIERLDARLLPENAQAFVRRADVVLEGADNFATKFLTADACRLAARPVVHGAAVRWGATVWCVGPAGRPCYRCLFEDVPHGEAGENCAAAGVMGPVVGFAGALMADRALSVLAGEPASFREILTYDGQADRLRAVEIEPRPQCPLCGERAQIQDIEAERYAAPRYVA